MAHSPLLSIQLAFVPRRLRRCQMVMENANSPLGWFFSFLYLIAVLQTAPIIVCFERKMWFKVFFFIPPPVSFLLRLYFWLQHLHGVSKPLYASVWLQLHLLPLQANRGAKLWRHLWRMIDETLLTRWWITSREVTDSATEHSGRAVRTQSLWNYFSK